MTPKQLRACLDAIGWRQFQLAEQLDIHETRVRRWLAGTTTIQPDVAEWLLRLAQAHVANKAPVVYSLPPGFAKERKQA